MDDWFDELNRTVETVRQDVEFLVKEATDAAVEFTDSMIQISEVVGEQVQETLLTEAEQMIGLLMEQVDEWLGPGQFSLDIDLYWQPDLGEPWVERVSPSATNHPACVGCKHYHGRIYSGNLLVCGMHPYGWEGDDCPDWERKMAGR
ncbi:MAG: hypothetical protein AAF289_04115 [Cyanobacteria bacterium P01_A01_bin.135]